MLATKRSVWGQFTPPPPIEIKGL